MSEIRKCIGRIRSAVKLGHDPETFIRELEALLEPPRGYVLTKARVAETVALERDMADRETRR